MYMYHSYMWYMYHHCTSSLYYTVELFGNCPKLVMQI